MIQKKLNIFYALAVCCKTEKKGLLKVASNYMIPTFSFLGKLWQLVMQHGVNITLSRFCMSLISQINNQSLIWNKQTERANESLKEIHEKQTRTRKTESDRQTHTHTHTKVPTKQMCDVITKATIREHQWKEGGTERERGSAEGVTEEPRTT